jgi:hypothetical protein
MINNHQQIIIRTYSSVHIHRYIFIGTYPLSLMPGIYISRGQYESQLDELRYQENFNTYAGINSESHANIAISYIYSVLNIEAPPFYSLVHPLPLMRSPPLMMCKFVSDQLGR